MLALLRWLWSQYPRRTLLVVCCMALHSLGASSSVFILIPLLKVLGVDGNDSADPAGATNSVLGHFENPLLWLLLIYLLLNLGSVLFRYFASMASIGIRERAVFRLREQLHRAAISIRWAEADRLSETGFRHVVVEEVSQSGQAIDRLIGCLSACLVLFAYLVTMSIIHWRATAAVLGAGLILGLALLTVRQVISKNAKGIVSQWSKLTFGVTGQLTTLKRARVSGDIGNYPQRFAALTRGLSEKLYYQRHLQAGLRAAMEFAAALLLVGFVAIFLLNNGGDLSPLLVFLYVCARSLMLLVGAQEDWVACSSQSASFQRVQTMTRELSARRTINLVGHAVDSPNEPPKALTLPVDWQSLSLNSVSYQYPSANKPALSDVSLTLERNSFIAIVGASGSGKSTLVDLLLGLLQPTSGDISIAARAEGHVSDNIRIDYIGPTPALMPDTLRNNLILGNGQSNDQEILNALDLFGLGQLTRSLPSGLDTIVGDGEATFSGGELQRIALARSWLFDPDFLILDEASSHLDSQREQQIINAWRQREKPITLLLVSHRMASVEHADCIHVMDSGVLAESGKFDALRRTPDSIFSTLCANQGYR